MDRTTLCKSLVRFRDDGIRLRAYLGFRWVILKVLLAALASLLLLHPDSRLHLLAFALLGYIAAMGAAGVRGYLLAKKRWNLQREFIHWEKVEECLDANHPHPKKSEESRRRP